MSILIRTGSGKTDLSYTDNAVKNLKVLQKTGTKSVHWITTQAGTTYNNILQKRGVKDLFYGNITIPSDEPAWYGNPYSGQLVNWEYTNLPNYSDIFISGVWSTAKGISPNEINVSDNNWNYSQGTNIFARSATSDATSIYFRKNALEQWERPPLQQRQLTVSKIFVVDVNNPKRKAVYLITCGKWTAQQGNATSYYCRNITIRDQYVTIDNFLDGGTYRVGIRATDS